jgi:2-deoxy-D-gluconate 3-dehydrogenase
LIIADVRETAAQETARYVLQCGGDGRAEKVNVMEDQDLHHLFQGIREKEGGLDILINCIGTIIRKPILEQNDEEWEHVLRLNLTAAMRISREAARLMQEQGRGKIIHVSSAVGLLAYPAFSAYASSKAGLNMLVKIQAMEWAPLGINVNGIAPGTAITRLNRDYYTEDPSRLKEKIAKIPAARLATCGDFVGAIIFLSSPASDYLHGAILPIDGGRTIAG